MNRQDFSDIQRMLEPLWRGITLSAQRVVVTLAKDSAAGKQILQMVGLDDDVYDSQEHMQPGGLHHRPAAGAEGVLLSMFGSLDDAVVIALSNRSKRPSIAVGETALYNDSATQTVVKIRLNGDVEVALADGAKLKVGDASDFVAMAEKVDAALAALETHVHADPASGFSGGPLDPDSLPAPNAPITFGPTASENLKAD